MENHLFFNEIIQSPEFLSIQREVAELLGESVWWVADAGGRRQPLQDKPVFCPIVRGDRKRERQCLADTEAHLSAVAAASGSVVQPCCQGYLRALIPFYYRSSLIGALGVCYLKESERERAQSAIDILERYIRLYGALLTEYDDLEYVHDIWQQMVSSATLEELLPRILEETLKALNLERGVLYLTDEDGKLVPRDSTVAPGRQVVYQYLEMESREYQRRFEQSPSFVLDLSDEDPLSRWTNRNLRPPGTEGVPLDWKDWLYLAIPLWRTGRLLGIMVVQMSKETPRPEWDERMLRLVTDGAAAVLENAINLDRIQQRSLALSTIHTIHRLMSSALGPQELVEKIARLATQVLRAEKCSVMTVGDHGGVLEPVAVVGLKPGELGTQPLRMGEGIPGHVLRDCEPLIVHYPYGDSRFNDVPHEVYLEKSYLAVPMIEEEVVGIITVSGRREPFSPSDREILLTLAEQAVIALGNARLIEQHQQRVLSSLRSIANVIETRDPYQPGQTERVEELAQRMGRVLSGDSRWLLNLRYAALLHDAGQIALRQQPFLRQPPGAGRSLNGEEDPEQLFREHPIISSQIALSMQMDAEAADMIRYHHENYDGTGFPEGLRGEQIPLGARVLALAVAYVTLEQKGRLGRPYSPRQILGILRKMAGRKFEPKLVEVLGQVC